MPEDDLKVQIEELREEVAALRALVAQCARIEVRHGVAELAVDVPGEGDRRTGVVLFAIPPSHDLGPGAGLRVWVHGNMSSEFAWWGEE